MCAGDYVGKINFVQRGEKIRFYSSNKVLVNEVKAAVESMDKSIQNNIKTLMDAILKTANSVSIKTKLKVVYREIETSDIRQVIKKAMEALK